MEPTDIPAGFLRTDRIVVGFALGSLMLASAIFFAVRGVSSEQSGWPLAIILGLTGAFFLSVAVWRVRMRVLLRRR